MESLIETFHLDWKLMLAQIVNFAIVFTVLYIFALKPLKKLMDERGKTIKGGLDNAEKQKELLAAAEAEYAALVAKANAEYAAKMKEIQQESKQFRAAEMEKVQAELAAALAKGREQAEAEKQKILEDARRELASIVVAATEKVLGDVMDKKLEAKVVEDSIKHI